MPDDSDRINLKVNPKGREDLNWLAAHREVPLWVAAQRAFAVERELTEAKARGARILLEVPGEPTCELALV